MFGTLIVLIGVASFGGVALLLLAEFRGQSLPHLLAGQISELQRVLSGWRLHPRRSWAVLESLLWLFFLLPLADNLLHPYEGKTAYWIWLLTIVQHEAGHFICAPFGWLLMFLGGSIWQLLFWFLFGVYLVVLRRSWAGAFLCWMVLGHSFINLSVYIRDAQERDMPLLFGMDKSHHDWWNILSHLGLLEYDNTFGDMAWSLGGLIAFACIWLGLLSTWYQPPEGA